MPPMVPMTYCTHDPMLFPSRTLAKGEPMPVRYRARAPTATLMPTVSHARRQA